MRRKPDGNTDRFCNIVPGNGGRAVWAGDTWADGEFPQAGYADAAAGAVSDRGQRTSWARGADGSAVKPAGGASGAVGSGEGQQIGFDAPVASGGYRWWYLDAISDDRCFGCTIIGFVGSVFSPYYAAARRHGGADPADHVAMNVALYGPGGRWAMTERGRRQLSRDACMLQIGQSRMRWVDGQLVVDIDEWGVPLPRRLRGRVVLRPSAIQGSPISLDPGEGHRWRPIAPCARVEVAFTDPDWRWFGHGYLDGNDGDAALEQTFREWNWSRAQLPGGDTAVVYDALRRDGTRFAFARRFAPDGCVADFTMPARHDLPRGLWGMHGVAHGAQVRLIRRLEDSPFYTRSLISTELFGAECVAVHESLSLAQFSRRWVQMMLPFRMPRWTWETKVGGLP